MSKKPDYTVNNYCRMCELVYPKTEIKCKVCKRLLRRGQKKKRFKQDFPRI